MNPRPTAATFGWGIFLACSWTWCIGLYLPVILLDEFGWPGFIVFAIPNVIGCVAFGYAVRNAAASSTLVREHRPAMVIFSLVTLTFHVFFLAFLLDVALNLGAAKWMVFFVPAALYLAACASSFLSSGAWIMVALGVYAISLGAFFAVGTEAAYFIEWTGGRTPPTDLAWLLPLFFFGFLLCPYLDLTFHRALQESPSRHSFLIFGLAFSVMLVLTCFIWFTSRQPLLAIAHLFGQSVFTMGVHLRELRLLDRPRGRAVRAAVLILPLLGLAVLPVVFAIEGESVGPARNAYIRFFIFYGLAFPAYALIFMRRAGRVNRSRRALMLFVAAVLLAAPCYEIAFFHERMWTVCIPVGAAFLWILIARR